MRGHSVLCCEKILLICGVLFVEFAISYFSRESLDRFTLDTDRAILFMLQYWKNVFFVIYAEFTHFYDSLSI